MLVEEWQRLLRRRLMLDQLAQRAEPINAVRKGRFTGVFQGFRRMLPRQREQALQHARAFDAAGVQHRLRPVVRAVADSPRTLLSRYAAPRSKPLIFSAARCWPMRAEAARLAAARARRSAPSGD